MKRYLALMTAATLALSACGDKPAPAPETSPVPAEASAPAASEVAPAAEVSAATSSTPAAATSDCSVVVSSNDAMQFNTKEIAVKSSCQQFTITLKHTGKAPAAAMGHNIVISKTADKDGVVSDGSSASQTNYVKPNDERVIAATKIIGGGEETSVTLNPAKLAKGEAYDFYCTFPGHSSLMNGKVTLVD
ncbi:azurin [Kingella negevensis]|uniref:azurin n=1 Tax=Kingella negevensis TaxID=1522312 RepID=UPI002543C81D|nr:azurin [Kingella negevensis]WII93960.1 azurin [Kingella negevensis]